MSSANQVTKIRHALTDKWDASCVLAGDLGEKLYRLPNSNLFWTTCRKKAPYALAITFCLLNYLLSSTPID